MFMAPRLPRLRLVPRSVLLHVVRLVALLAWVGQTVIVAAPVLDANAAVNWAPHVESHGSPLHHAHTPNLCAACSAIALVGRPEPVRTPFPPVGRSSTAARAAAVDPVYRARRSAVCPRAPPMGESESTALSWRHSDPLILSRHASRTMAVRPPARGAGRHVRTAA
jgi:hypothetical protein